MFRVLIVDDEEIILRGVKRLIEKKLQLPFEVEVCVAASAAAALEEAKVFGPDLILTDIRMPETDGFSFVEQLRSGNIDCDIAILTSHADFTYAKRAISFQVRGFLLKPVEKRELEEILLDSYRRGEENREEEERECLLQLRSILLYDVEGELADEDILHGMFPYRYFTVVLVESETAGGRYAGLLEAEIAYFACSRTFYLASAKQYVTMCNHEKFNLDVDLLKAGVRKIFWQEEYYCSVSISSNSWTELHSLYTNARLRIFYEKLYVENKVLADISFITYRDCIDIFTENDRQKMRERLGEYLDRILDQYAASPGLFQGIGSSFVRNCNTYLENLGAGCMENPFEESGIESKEEMIQAIQHSILLYRERRKEADISRNEPVCVPRIAAYISCHYIEDISLETLAEALELHPNYICAVFKKHFGESFLTYLQKVRVSAAKEMLRSSRDYTLKEVAEKVGYPNADRLIRIFKKYEGVTPGEFKKMYE
jgi:YesN/AraC family two-component response regulator